VAQTAKQNFKDLAMTTRLNRRSLLKRTAAAAAAVAGAKMFPVPAVLAEPAPGSKLNCVVIGVANQGISSINAAANKERLMAMVDVDDAHIANTMDWLKEKAPETDRAAIKTFYDYRKMFDEIGKQIDAVFVAAPDHHHFPATMMALELGKPVYVEKPMAHSIDEVRRMAAKAREKKVVTQMGNQGHSSEHVRRLCEYIWDGAIGNVTETYSWAPTGRGGKGPRLPKLPVPQGLHWDEWIGPAQFRDYHDELHPKMWRSWWEFGDGSVGDWGCHNLDGVYMALKLGTPDSVEILDQDGGSDERYPLVNAIRYTFPARGDMPPVKVHWYDGYKGPVDSRSDDEEAKAKYQNRPPIVAEIEKKYSRDLKNGGVVYIGDKGIMVTGNYSGGPRIVPEEQHRATPRPDKTLPRVKGTHQDDFFRACRGGDPACSNFDYAAGLTEIVLLGCLAEKAGPGKKIQWDPVKMECKGLPELNPMIKREYRKGWGI
jgi:predicted dehydrogenase